MTKSRKMRRAFTPEFKAEAVRLWEERRAAGAAMVIVDGNPAYNLKFLYAVGDLTIDKDRKMFRTKGVVHTIKDGIVIENARLMAEVEKMVTKSKQGVPAANAVTSPFLGGVRPIVPEGGRR